MASIATLIARSAEGSFAAAGTPGTISAGTLLAWLKADAITGVTDGSTLASWSDSSAHALTFNTLAGTAPKYRAAGGPAGLPCVDHTLAAGGLSSSTSTTLPSGDYTYFAVVQTSFSAIQNLMNAASGEGEAQLRLNNFHVEVDKAGTIAIKTSTASLIAGTWTIAIVTFTSVGNVVHFETGGVVEDYTLGGTTTFKNPGVLSYGNYVNSAVLFNGKMAEIGVYSSVLSPSDLTALKSYLTTKYSL